MLLGIAKTYGSSLDDGPVGNGVTQTWIDMGGCGRKDDGRQPEAFSDGKSAVRSTNQVSSFDGDASRNLCAAAPVFVQNVLFVQSLCVVVSATEPPNRSGPEN